MSTFDAFRWRLDYDDFTRGGTGVGLRFLYPLTALGYEKLFNRYSLDEVRIGAEYRFEQAEITDINRRSPPTVVASEGESITSSIRPLISRNTLNSLFDPTRGSAQEFSIEYAGLGGQSEFLKVDAKTRHYWPVYKSPALGTFVYSIAGQVGYGQGFEGVIGNELPLFERYFPGGINSVRGFKTRTLGPREAVFDPQGEEVNTDPIGGSRQLIVNNEFIFPIVEPLGLKGVVLLRRRQLVARLGRVGCRRPALRHGRRCALAVAARPDSDRVRLPPQSQEARQDDRRALLVRRPAVGATIDRHFTCSKEIILMRRFILITASLSMMLALVLPALPASGADFKVGIVDLQRALNESSSGKKAKDQFKGEFEKMQGGLKAEKDSLDRLKDDLDKKSAVLSDDQRKSKMEDFERRRRDLRRKLEDSDAELRKKDQELTGNILKDLAVVIQEIGEREGYTIILENSSSSVLYGSKSIDITDSVIKAFDAKH